MTARRATGHVQPQVMRFRHAKCQLVVVAGRFADQDFEAVEHEASVRSAFATHLPARLCHSPGVPARLVQRGASVQCDTASRKVARPPLRSTHATHLKYARKPNRRMISGAWVT